MDIHFEFLHALFLLLLLPGIYFLYQKYNSEKKSAALKFSSLKIIKKSESTIGWTRKHLPFILLLSALGISVIGLTNPQISAESLESGVNVVLVLDGSESMTANDYNPTRLDATKEAAGNLIKRLGPNDKVGIILFESGATTISYLTPAKDKVLDSLNLIQQRQGATALGDGIVLGVDMAISDPNHVGTIIVLSDGVHNSGAINPSDALQYAKSNNVKIHAIGMGSEEPVFIRNDIFGEPQFAHLDEETLKVIASSTNGKYFKSIDEKTLNEIFVGLGENIERDFEYESVSYIFYGVAIAILVSMAYLIYGRYKIIV